MLSIEKTIEKLEYLQQLWGSSLNSLDSEMSEALRTAIFELKRIIVVKELFFSDDVKFRKQEGE